MPSRPLLKTSPTSAPPQPGGTVQPILPQPAQVLGATGQMPGANAIKGVSARLPGITKGSGALGRHAMMEGKAFANKRGLLNSSIAAGAAHRALLDKAVQIAEGDVTSEHATADRTSREKTATADRQSRIDIADKDRTSQEMRHANQLAAERDNLMARFQHETGMQATELSAREEQQLRQLQHEKSQLGRELDARKENLLAELSTRKQISDLDRQSRELISQNELDTRKEITAADRASRETLTREEIVSRENQQTRQIEADEEAQRLNLEHDQIQRDLERKSREAENAKDRSSRERLQREANELQSRLEQNRLEHDAIQQSADRESRESISTADRASRERIESSRITADKANREADRLQREAEQTRSIEAQQKADEARIRATHIQSVDSHYTRMVDNLQNNPNLDENARKKAMENAEYYRSTQMKFIADLKPDQTWDATKLN